MSYVTAHALHKKQHSFIKHLLTILHMPILKVAKPWIGWSVAYVTSWVCVCQCSKRKTAQAINTKIGRPRQAL